LAFIRPEIQAKPIIINDRRPQAGQADAARTAAKSVILPLNSLLA
jgi:hypothetical protein